MDGLERLYQQIELPLQLAVYLRAYLVAEFRDVLLGQLVVLDQPANEVLHAEYPQAYLLPSFRMSHSNPSSKSMLPLSASSLSSIAIVYSLTSLGMSMDEKFSRIPAYFFSRVL